MTGPETKPPDREQTRNENRTPERRLQMRLLKAVMTGTIYIKIIQGKVESVGKYV